MTQCTAGSVERDSSQVSLTRDSMHLGWPRQAGDSAMSDEPSLRLDDARVQQSSPEHEEPLT